MKEVLQFLRELELNNNKEWMDAHRDAYENARDSYIDLVQSLIDRNKEFDIRIKELTAKECIFRINRDVRFSKNKTPYKPYMGAAIAPWGGKKSWKPGYYLHISPHGKSMICGGVWKLDPPLLKAIRKQLAKDYQQLENLVESKSFKSYFQDLHGESVKTAPVGYSKDHPALDFLKMKSYYILHYFSDEEVTQADFLEKVIEGCKKIKPLNMLITQRMDNAIEAGDLDERLVEKETL